MQAKIFFITLAVDDLHRSVRFYRDGLGWPTNGVVGTEFHDEVDELLRLVEAAGGTLTAPPHMRPFGVYSGYFADPDGHLFEIAWDSNSS